MRSKSPELMKEICTFVGTYYRSKGSSPSLSETAKGVGIAKTTAYRYLVDMNERGMISYDGQTIETPQSDKCVSGYFSAPIVGSIRCGDPETEEEHVEEYVSLPESIFGKGEFYILRATGDSMVDAGIEDKDLVVIRKQDLGFNYSPENMGAPWSNMFMMMLVCVTMGIICSYVMVRSNNVMYPAIIHGVVNVIGEIPVFISVSGKNGLLGPNPTGLISMSGLILCAIIMLIKLPTAKMVKGRKDGKDNL